MGHNDTNNKSRPYSNVPLKSDNEAKQMNIYQGTHDSDGGKWHRMEFQERNI